MGLRQVVVVAALAALATAANIAERSSRQKRQARSNVQDCMVTPNYIGDPKTPAKSGESIEIRCNTDKAYDFCHFEHQALTWSTSNQVDEENAISCNIAGGARNTATTCNRGSQGNLESRITSITGLSETQCGIRISKSDPEDTGVWTITVGEIATSGSVQSNRKEVEIFTYAQTEPYIMERRNSNNDPETNLDRKEVQYNWDEDEEDWVEGWTSSYERVELTCNTTGRPEPTIKWVINRNDRDDLSSKSDIFRISEGSGSSYDRNGYIKDFQSDIDFEVNGDLMRYLSETHGINVNPSNAQFDFDLECLVTHGANGEYGEERQRTTVTVKRIEFTDTLSADTIGMIVGIVLGVLLLIVVCLVLVFLKATERLCFADSEQSYGYRDPKRSRPVNAQH